MQFKFEAGQVLYTKAGNYAEVIGAYTEDVEYPVLVEVTTGNESNLVYYSLKGEYLIGKKTTMDLDLSL